MKNSFKLIENYKGFDIVEANYRSHESKYIGVIIDGIISAMAFYSIKAAKKAIDNFTKRKLV